MDKNLRRYHDAIAVAKLLEDAGHAARLAGGSVRDRLLGLTPKDYDIATGALPEQVTAILQKHKIKVIPTGIQHGTVTACTNSGNVEITTLRVDEQTDGRHATVSFTGEDFELDARRRDFTVNALYEDTGGNIYDYVGGKSDLESKTLRFVGDAKKRIEEDALRIMRFFRFWGQLGFAPDSGDTLQVIKAHGLLLKNLSRERISAELYKLLISAKPTQALEAMRACEVFPHILSQAQLPEDFQAIDKVDFQNNEVCFLARLAFLCGWGQDAKCWHSSDVDLIGIDLKLANDQTKKLRWTLTAIQQLHTLEDDLLAQMNWLDHICQVSPAFDTDIAALVQLLVGHDKNAISRFQVTQKTELAYSHLRTAKLPIDGRDIMQHFQLGPCETLGTILRDAKNAYRLQEWKTRSQAFLWLDENRRKWLD